MSDKDVEVLKRDVQKILFYLHNDNGTGQKGLVAEVAEMKVKLEKIITDQKTAQAVKKATIGAWATIGGVMALLIKWVASFILNHLHF